MKDNFETRSYPEDETLREVQSTPDGRMTREEWEREESAARQAAHKKHDQVKHDRQVQQEFDKKNPKPHRNWGKILLWAVAGAAVLLLIFLVGYLPRHAHQKKAEQLSRQREQEQPEVEVMQVKRAHSPAELTVPGTTAAYTEAYLYARANGYLRKRYADIGDHVRKGQLLAIIDAPDLDQQVDQARQQLKQAEAQQNQQQAQLNLNRVTWERWRTLVAKGVFSRQDGDQREADFNTQLAVVSSAQRNVESYRANLDRMIALQSYERITSPFDGVITQRNADVGALLGSSGSAANAPMASPQTPTGGSSDVASSNNSGTSGTANQSATPSTGQAAGGAIFGVAQIDKLRIFVSVPEGYASSVKTGMPAKVFVQERANQPISGKVVRTASSVDLNTRTLLTEIDIDNRDGNLFPGMYTVVSFVQVRGVALITVPGDAVVVRQDKNTIAVVRDQKIQMVPVEIGRDYGPAVEILSGLKEGDTIVTTVTDSVQPGIKVRTRQSEQSQQQSTPQTSAAPDSGPDQYGDQSIVDSKSESTNQKGKPGKGGGGQKSGEGSGQQSGGKQPKQSKSGSGQ